MKQATATIYDFEPPEPVVQTAVPRPGRRVVIEPTRGIRWIDFPELWAYRTLIRTLTARHIQVRYAQSVLGVGWALVQPLVTMVVFTIIFGKFAKVPSDGVPYQVFSLAGVIPWTYFSAAVTGASTSLSNSSTMLTKVYFPRLGLPMSYIGAPIVDLAIGLVMLLVLMLWFGVTPSAQAFTVIPIAVLTMMLTAMGVGAGLSALDVQFRDVKHIVPFMLQVWMYGSPIVYPMSVVPARYRPFYALNPIAGVVEAFRSVLVGTHAVDWSSIGVSFAMSAMVFVGGVLYFRQRERVFADVV